MTTDASDPTSIVWLDDPAALDVSRAGGKLAGLARLGRAGHRIPAGFVVPAQSASARPDRLAAAIDTAYASLAEQLGEPTPSVAVRSSSTVEDGHEFSHAGLFVSVLGVRGASAVHEAALRCLESTGASHEAYRARFELPERAEVAVGVVELIRARASGVAFSRHPVASRRDRVVIESTFGYGPALVEGRIIPDRVELDRDDLRILRVDVGAKAWRSSERDDGLVSLEPMPDELASKPSITVHEATAIAREALAIEALLGHPVDVEWVLDARTEPARLVVVQARPITGVATSPEPVRWDAARYASIYGFGGRR